MKEEKFFKIKSLLEKNSFVISKVKFSFCTEYQVSLSERALRMKIWQAKMEGKYRS